MFTRKRRLHKEAEARFQRLRAVLLLGKVDVRD
jgi:hypothetical protein